MYKIYKNNELILITNSYTEAKEIASENYYTITNKYDVAIVVVD